MLQNAAFMTMFREAAKSRGNVKDLTVATLNEAGGASDTELTPTSIFAELGRNSMQAARQVKQFLTSPQQAHELIDAARVLVFLKGNDAHDYKFSSAVLEDYYRISPTWRDTYLASNVFQLQHSGRADNELVARHTGGSRVDSLSRRWLIGYTGYQLKEPTMSTPHTSDTILDRHFLELRCEILNLAAALDRIERADGYSRTADDPRLAQLQQGIGILATGGTDRAQRVQMLFSDQYEAGWNAS